MTNDKLDDVAISARTRRYVHCTVVYLSMPVFTLGHDVCCSFVVLKIKVNVSGFSNVFHCNYGTANIFSRKTPLSALHDLYKAPCIYMLSILQIAWILLTYLLKIFLGTYTKRKRAVILGLLQC